MFSANALVVGEASRRVNYNWGFFIALLVNTAVAAVIVTVDAIVSGSWFAWEPLPLLLFGLAGVFATLFGRLLFYVTVVGMGPSRASAFQITQPLFSSVLGFAVLGQRLSTAEIALMMVVLGGLFIVNRSRAAIAPKGQSPPVPTSALASGPASEAASGETAAAVERFRGVAARQRLLIAAVGSGVCYALANVLRSAAVNRWNEPLIGAFLGAFAGLVCYSLLNTRMRNVPARLRATDPRGLRMFMVSGVLGILAQTASIASLRHLPVAIANMFSVSLPIIVVPVSVLLLHNREGITRLTVVGVAVTWLGVVGLVIV